MLAQYCVVVRSPYSEGLPRASFYSFKTGLHQLQDCPLWYYTPIHPTTTSKTSTARELTLMAELQVLQLRRTYYNSYSSSCTVLSRFMPRGWRGCSSTRTLSVAFEGLHMLVLDLLTSPWSGGSVSSHAYLIRVEPGCNSLVRPLLFQGKRSFSRPGLRVTYTDYVP